MARDTTASDNRILAAMAAGCQLTRWSYYAHPRHADATPVMVLLHPDGRRRHVSRREPVIRRLEDAGAFVFDRWIDDWDGLSDKKHVLYLLTDAGRERAAGVTVDLEKLFTGPHVTSPERDHMAVYRNERTRMQAAIRSALADLGWRMDEHWF